MKNEWRKLPEKYEGKVISSNFGHIKHLSGSKLIDKEDVLMSVEAQKKFTDKVQDPTHDRIIVSEKIDGMNGGAVKKNGLIYPINRKGYDSRQMGTTHEELKPLGNGWAQWVDDHYETLDELLEEGERLVFENAMFQHTIRYKFKNGNGPVFLLAKFDNNNKKLPFEENIKLAEKIGITIPPVLYTGVIAIDPRELIRQFPKGLVGAIDGIEGVVYRYEHIDDKGVVNSSYAKYVSNVKFINGDSNKGFSGIMNKF